MEDLEQKISNAVKDGYSVVVSHEDAFNLAERIGADILPLFLHGTDHVMPKGSGLAARGNITIEIGERIAASQLNVYGNTHLEIANGIQRIYSERYEEIKKELEDSHYYHDYVIYKYLYKGIGVEKETRKMLKKYNDFSTWIDDYNPSDPSSHSVSILNAGKGQFSLLFALVHPDIEVYSYTDDFDDLALAHACVPVPDNLHIINNGDNMSDTRNAIDLKVILSS